MYAVDFELQNGNKVQGLVWKWDPANGFFEALDESNGKVKKYSLSEVKSGVFYSDRDRKVAQQEDLLEKAKSGGFAV